MAKFDIESFQDSVLQIIKDNINAKIAEINTEKADSITLETIDTTNAFANDLNEVVVNFDPFVYHGISAINPTAIGGATSNNITLFFEVIFAYNADGNSQIRKVLRYSRILQEIVEEKQRKILGVSNLEIQQLVPLDVRLSESDQQYKIGGIHLSGTLF